MGEKIRNRIRNKSFIAVTALITTIVIILVALIGNIYATEDKHYAVDVVKGSASNEGKDKNLLIRDEILKKPDGTYEDKELMYQVELKNIIEASSIENQIAMVVDTSYSMEINDTNSVVRAKAIEIAKGIMTNVDNSAISFSNYKGLKNGMTRYNDAQIESYINNMIFGEGDDGSKGLDNAYSSFTNAQANKYIIIFTDATDDVTEKMLELKAQDPNLHIISILVDMTSTSYIVDNENVCDDVYILLSEVTQADIPNNLQILEPQVIYDRINKSLKNVVVTNEFTDSILTYFDITDLTASAGQVIQTQTGYRWEIDKIKLKGNERLTFKLTLKTEKNIDAGLIFKEICTNKEQNVEYVSYDNSGAKTIEGNDSREGTDSTTIKICQGYDLKIKAVNEANHELQIEGIEFEVIGTNENNEEVCHITRTTDAFGYITITTEDTRALRTDGTIRFTVIPKVNKVGYEETAPVTFDIISDKITRKLDYRDNQSRVDIKITDSKRLVEAIVPIDCQKSDLEIQTRELGNDQTTISGCEFQLIQPKLNNQYEMDVLIGKTDENGVVHFNPTVMTKNGTYQYILVQNSAQNGYEVTNITLIELTYKDGIITKSSHQFNPNVETKVCDDKENHVLVTVLNENTAKDPFDLQINLSDIADGTKLEGVTYLVQTTNSNNQVKKEYVTTDANGQAIAKIYGTGNLIVEITEQSPKVGYVADRKTKSLTIVRNNGQIKVPFMNPSDLNLDLSTGSLIVNLASQKKTEQNIVKVSLVEAEEHDVTVGRNVIYYLQDTETQMIYGPAISDRNGELSFTVDNKEQGTHRYILRVDKNSISPEYDQTKIADEIGINLEYDADGYISDMSSVIDDQTVIDSHYSIVSKDDKTEYTYFITIGYELEAGSTIPFIVQLSDYEETSRPIVGASYNIDIEYEINGVIRTKNIKERKTNSQGIITTNVVKGNNLTINVQEVKASSGYSLDYTTQEIQLIFKNNGEIQINQSPYNRNPSNPGEPVQGAYINSGTVVYQHYNKKRNAEDTYVNLTINKVDPNGLYVGGLPISIKSETLVDKTGRKLDIITYTDNSGQIVFDYEQYLNDKQNKNIIRAPGIGTDGEEIIHNIEISELVVDKESPTGFKERPGTTVKVRLIFKLRDDRISLIKAEGFWGNRLLVGGKPQYSSASDTKTGQETEDSLGVYLANVILNLYTNYDEVGNLSLDFKKQNILEDKLDGAEYEIKIVNPDGKIMRKNITIDNGGTIASTELTGITANIGTLIYITEIKAPIGYGVNSSTETLEVKDITADGEVIVEQIDQGYAQNRLKIEQLPSTLTTSGKNKTNYEITLTDHQLDTFGFEVIVADKATQELIKGYGFSVKTSLGAESQLVTGEDGLGTTKVGGNIVDSTITYTLSANKIAEWYKPLKQTLQVNVVFDEEGKVDIERTMQAQNDSTYGTLWTIEQVSDEEEGSIRIKVLIDHQDPLVVNVQTIDKITNANIADVQYRITESAILPGTGSNHIEVGYVKENGLMTYTIEQTSIKNSYAKVDEKTFTIEYKNEVINNTPTITSSESMDTITKTGDREVTIKIYVEPKVPFEITDLYYFDHTQALQGSNFEVTEVNTENVGTGTTNASGITGIYSGIFGTNEEKIYKVRQTLGAVGYATVEDFYVKVGYNGNREIISAKLVNERGEDVTNNRFVTISYVKTSTFSNYNGNNKGIVTIQVLNYPEFRIDIKDVDRRDGTTPIPGATYSVTSKYLDSENNEIGFIGTKDVITDATGVGIAHLDKTKDNTIVTYTVKEDAPGVGYQSIGTDIEVIVTYDSQGYVSAVELGNNNIVSNIATVSKKNITSTSDPKDNFIVDLELKNNPILKFNLTAMDTKDHSVKIKDLGFQMVSKYDEQVYSNSSATNKVNQTETPETSYTNLEGYTAIYMDRTLDNKEMIYTLKEVQKTPGYDWIDQDIIIKIVYDADGKISSITPVQGGAAINITSYDANTFEVNIDVYNEEIKEFGIHLTATDTYDKDKKLNGMEVEAFLAELGNNSYIPQTDGKYQLLKEKGNALVTGEDKNEDGVPDLAYGEDYKTMGQYTSGAGTRTLRLIVKNDSSEGGKGGTYYLDSTGNNIGYYRGSRYYADAKYQTVGYEYLINVTFDDEGKILDAQLQTGNNSIIGWLADGRYVEPDLTHTDYRLNITMKFFPLLDLKLNAMNNFTYQDEINKDGQPIALEGSRYTVSTQRRSPGPHERDEFVTAGYIGPGHTYGIGQVVDGAIYEGTDELFVPIENNHTRQFYVFEEVEPTNYQKYRDRFVTIEPEKLVAIIQVAFDSKGEIDYNNSIVRKVETEDSITIIKPYINESLDGYLSSNNIKEYNYYYDKTEANRNINFYIGYGLTTKIHITAVDDISGNKISNIRMYPFVNNSTIDNGITLANTPYEWSASETGYRDTNSEGESSWKYWGAATDNMFNQYTIGSSRITNDYNGYLFPSDMAQISLGGSGNLEDYYVKLDITYGSDGKISNVQSMGSDLWGDNNATNITFDKETGNVNIDILYSRKFQMTLNKVDYYDRTINKLVANFAITSNKGLNTQLDARAMRPIGKVYKDTTIRYTLSENTVPDGYYPIPGTIDFDVKFDKDGNIDLDSVKSKSEYFEAINTSETTEKINKASPDLEINIKNKPALVLDTRVIDQFYKEDGLKDAYLEVISSKGDVASGNPQTDINGYARITAGPVYPNETVTYTITQTNTVNGYYPMAAEIKLKVKYNEAGKIEDYSILQGNEVINNFNDYVYRNKREISMQIMNMPKDLKIGLYKYDKLTNQPMAGVPFTITETNVNTGDTKQENILTETNGAVIKVIDTFNTSLSGKAIKYVIHESQTPATYRTMQDIVFVVQYNPDGSMKYFNQIDNDNGVLNTNITLDIASDGIIRYLNNERVHFKVEVPNDNAYDLIIKNEDINFDGLGIPESIFDVSINGVTYTPSQTNENGKTQISNITESGSITMNISQNKVGDGYKDDIDNKISIQLEKGVNVYSLDLATTTAGYVDDKNAVTTKAIVEVDEIYGTVTVTFKNETKTEINILKQDVNSKIGLQGAKFEVRGQQIDDSGNKIGNPIILTTGNEITDDQGLINLNLGVAPQSQIWEYTFVEIVAPKDYNQIADVTMTVKYDQYGRIIEQTSNKQSRLSVTREHEEKANCRNMYAAIYNGDISPAYTVKVVTEDAETGKRISGSKIFVNITNDETGEPLTIQPITKGSSKNGVISETMNMGIDGKMYTDGQINNDNQGKIPPIIDRGLMYIDNIDFEGTINIDISQKEEAPGYVFGQQKTDTTNGIKIKATYEPHLDDDPTVKFDVIDNDQFIVTTNPVSKVITIKILNESRVTFDITTMVYGTDKPDSSGNTSPQYIPGINYDITAEIDTITESTDAGINVTTPLTDKDGKTKGNVGTAFAGKTVVYTLKQRSTLSEYSKIDDIKVEVKYDSSGYIKNCELLSSEDFTTIEETKTQGRTISLVVKNKRELGSYTIFVEKHAMDTDEDEGGYGRLLPGAKYKITVEEKNATTETKVTTWTDVTDENGLIRGIPCNGFGYITITLEELFAPDGYKVADPSIYKIYRDKNTGEVSTDDSNVNIGNPKDDWSEIYLMPVDQQAEGKYTLVINKKSATTGKYITASQAQFEAELIGKNDEEEIIFQDTIENRYTNKNGKIEIDNLDLPREPGKYTLTIRELTAPEGYKKLEKPVELNVILERDSQENIIISSATPKTTDNNVTTSKVDKQVIGVNIFNEVDMQIKEDEYSLDITKVDAETGEAIGNMAIFKVELPDEQKTSVYTETMETLLGEGKLDYCYIEQDKDYGARLTHLKLPEEPCTLQYTFREITPPEGYQKIEDDLTLTLEFAEDPNTGKLRIEKATSSNEKYLKIKDATQLPCPTDTPLSIDILNDVLRPQKYTITYDDNVEDLDIDVPEAQIKIENEDLTLDTMVPVRDGYTFKGWSIYPNTAVAELQPGDNFVLNQNITLYAVWELNSFKITYDDNVDDEEIDVPDVQEKQKEVDIYLSYEEPVREGYYFLGWSTDKDATEAEYKPEQRFTKDENTTLYAVWKLKTYTITYNDGVEDEEIEVPEEQSKNYGQTINISTDIPERTGYDFKGWLATDKEQQPITNYNPGDEYTDNENLNLTAIWELKTYEITYNANVDDPNIQITVPDTQIKNYGENIVLTEEVVPVRDGYIFDGWSTDKDATGGQYVPGDEYTDNADLELYAIWTEKLFLRSDEYQIINAVIEATKRKTTITYDTEQIHEYNEGDRFIIGIRPQYNHVRPGKQPSEEKKGTNFTTLKDNLITNADNIKVIKNAWNSEKTGIEQKEITEEELVGTNMKIKLTKGKTQSIELTLVVIGDFFDNKDETKLIAGDGSEIYYTGDGVIMPNDDDKVYSYYGKFINNGRNLTLSGDAFIIVNDMYHIMNQNSSEWADDFHETFNKGSSRAIIDNIKEKGFWLNN